MFIKLEVGFSGSERLVLYKGSLDCPVAGDATACTACTDGNTC